MKIRSVIIPYPKELHLTIYGDAIAKARAQVIGRKQKKDGTIKKTHSFTPKTTEEWEASVFGQLLSQRPPYPYDGPVGLSVCLFKKIPQKWRAKKWERGIEQNFIRPAGARDDLDNLIKAIKDGSKSIIWLDDGQVVEYPPMKINGKILNTGKYYSKIPRVEIQVTFLPKFSKS